MLTRLEGNLLMQAIPLEISWGGIHGY
jgi:hypothetical protein